MTDVSFQVHFIFAHVTDFSEHVASVFFPGYLVRELNSNLTKKSV